MGYPDDDWVLLDVSSPSDPQPFTVRARSSLPPAATLAANPHLVIVTWTYGDAGESGMPTGEASDDMAAFQERIITLELQGFAIEAACVTGHGEREWRLYTRDVKQFMRGFNDVMADDDPRPIKLSAFEDPEWGALSEWLDTPDA